MHIADFLELLKPDQDWFDRFEPAVYFDKNQNGWFGEIYIFDKDGKYGESNHLVYRSEFFPKRSKMSESVFAFLSEYNILYPFNQVVDLTKDA